MNDPHLWPCFAQRDGLPGAGVGGVGGRGLSHQATDSRIAALFSTHFLFSLEMSFLGGGISFKQEERSNLNLRKLGVIRCTKSNTEEGLGARVGRD